jgi:hypothetical protein
MLQDLPFFSSHVGSVPGSGLEFDAFLGSEEWGNSIIAKWDNFLLNVYRKRSFY